MFLNLIAEIKRLGFTQKAFAVEVDINEITFSKKLNSRSQFNYKEIIRIMDFFRAKNCHHTFDYLFEETIQGVA